MRSRRARPRAIFTRRPAAPDWRVVTAGITSTTGMNRPSLSLRKRCFAWLAMLFCALVAVLVIAGIAAWITLRASLPQLDGTREAPGLSAPVTIERDAL